MAAPARKRVLKKVSAKTGSESETLAKPTKAAKPEKATKSEKPAKIEKSAKVSKKKVVEAPVPESAKEASAPAAPKAKKGVIPVPIFQAPARTKDSAKKSASSAADKKVERAATSAESISAAKPGKSDGEGPSEAGEGRSRHRNRRRGGRGEVVIAKVMAAATPIRAMRRQKICGMKIRILQMTAEQPIDVVVDG